MFDISSNFRKLGRLLSPHIPLSALLPRPWGFSMPARRRALVLPLLLAAALAALTVLFAFGGAPAQAQDGAAPPVSNLRCIAETERVAFLWDVPEWSGGEASSYDYELTLPGGREEGGRLHHSIALVYRPGSYPSGSETRFSITANYKTSGGGSVAGAEATLTCYVGGARPLTITPSSATREYGGTDDLSYAVSGLADGDAAGDVVSGALSRAPGDDVGSYAINLGTLSIAPAYGQKYALPSGPAVASYVITPRGAAYTATGVNKQYDGTTAVNGPLNGGFAAGDILTGDTVTVSGGTYASADAGTGIAVSGVSAGGADAGNYQVTFRVNGDITPRGITAISGVRVNARQADGTTDATFDTGGARATGALPGELADLRAGGLVVSGAFPSAEAGSWDVSVTYSLQDNGAFKAGNYTLSPSAAAATLHGQLRETSARAAAGCEPSAGDDYDADDDGLIEVCNLAQLSAVRFDLDGDGSASGSAIDGAVAGYKAAFPGIAANGPGCPASGCIGYELSAGLDFDTNGNGRADAGDAGALYGDNEEGWPAIGKYAAVFEGNGHAIRHLYFRSVGLAYPKVGLRRGLFDELGASGVIRNVVLENVRVDGNGKRVGALVGDNRGTISNVGVSGTVSGLSITGGLVGRNYGTVKDSYSSGEVSSRYGIIGGLVGQNWGGRIVRSYSTADVSRGTATAYEGWPTEHLDIQPYAYGGLVGHSYSIRISWERSESIAGSIVGSYATGRVTSGADETGGLVGWNDDGEIFASYATGDVSGAKYVGGLAGRSSGPISASYALGSVSGKSRVGGLVGSNRFNHRNQLKPAVSHQCVGCTLPNVRPGQADRNGITASYTSYWNAQAPSRGDRRRTPAELRQPTGYDGIYVHWDDLRDVSGDAYAWDFGTSLDFPVLRDTGPSVAAQRARMPDPPESEPPPDNRPTPQGNDYDRDDDGLIEVYSLAQLYVIRYDMVGTGARGWDRRAMRSTARDAYQLAYPRAMDGMGCPEEGCIGYELMTDLDFDTNGNGRTDSGDHYWNGVHLPDDSAYCIDWYKWHPQQSVRETPGACDDYWGNGGQGWIPFGQVTGWPWYGIFEGNGHAIRNLYINTLGAPFTEEGLNRYTDLRGLFQDTTYKGIVRNLRLENVAVSGTKYVGAVAATNRGIISNVHVTGSVTGIKSVGALVGDAKDGSFVTGNTSQATVTERPAPAQAAPAPANQAPTASGSLTDVTVTSGGGTKEVSLTGLFDDADGDALTITARTLTITADPPPDHDGNSYIEVVSVSVSADQSSLTLTGRTPGTATVTVTAADGNGGTALVEFVATVAAEEPQEQEPPPQQQQQTTPQDKYADLIAQMYEWRNGPEAQQYGKPHTDRWDRALLAFGETVADAAITPMTAAEAQALADQDWGVRWVPVARALWEIEGNRAPTVASAIADATIVNQSGTRQVSLTGVFSDADNDALTISAASSDEAVATVSVAAGQSSLTVSARGRGTATITVTADDGKAGAVSDAFSVTVKAAPTVASALADLSGLEVGATQEVSLSGVFSDADGDSLTITAVSSNDAIATVTVAADYASLTAAGVAAGTATVTVTAQDADGNRVSDQFDVTVTAPQQQDPPPNRAPTVADAIGDATIVNESGTRQASLSGVFSDADNDPLTVTAASSDEAVATVSVAADYSGLTVSAQARGTASITVTADDGNGGTVEDAFTVTVKAAPVVASALADVSGLEAGSTRDVSLSGAFSDADGDALTVTAASSDNAKATVTVASDGSKLTLTAVAEGAATITVTAQDTDGNRTSDEFAVTVAKAPEPEQDPPPDEDPSTGPPTVANPIDDFSLEGPEYKQISLMDVFHDPDGDELTFSAVSSNYGAASMWVDGSTLTVVGIGTGTATITVTAEDPDGNTVSDQFEVTARPVS